jgi:parvulin-like peptidyl-prolyl isomerase
MTSRAWVGVAAAVVLAAALGCRKGAETKGAAAPVVARVGDRAVTAADVYRGLYPQGKPAQAKVDPVLARRVLEQLVDRALILGWAGANGVKVPDADVEARLGLVAADYGPRSFDSYLRSQGLNAATFRQIIRDDLTVEAATEKAVVEKVSVSYEDVVTYYNTHPAEFEAPAQYHLLQIITDDRAKADAALTKLSYGATFEDVAREVSLSPDRHTGGDIGYAALDALPAEVAAVAKTLVPGTASGVIATPYGFEIVKVLNVRAAGPRPLAEVRTDIEDRLRDEREARLYQSWLGELRRNAKVAVDEKALAAL